MTPARRPARPSSIDVDWSAAARLAGRLASPGPTDGRAELERLVNALHVDADRALPIALTASRLGDVMPVSPPARVLVVDRPGWARAAARSFAGMTGDGPDAAVTAPSRGHAGAGRAPHGQTLQTGALLAVLSGRVLGQFDPFGTDEPGGHLLLVAPNVLRTQRALGVDPEDFRLWVCVHEQTHALQFAAAPWLTGYLRDQVAQLMASVAGTTTTQDMGALLGAVVRALRPGGPPPQEGDWPLLDAVLEEPDLRRVEAITAVMSLLEGHADVTMDSVGRSVIPSRRRLRSRLDARRTSAGRVDRVLRQVLGIDAKLAQYRRGASFVRTVRRAGGRGALDAVWSGPQALPTAREIADPRAWVRRVHG
ncbi:zinc-dependent metalloprotease [Actinotalea sp. K2]|uniref:zinc-dependent metalloprotease n=1 Tax=Actinotalea sp. K2 TaxID=2939438 RepID=UPI0020171747|nr:zinc-dependent metalloprotease [Actinotalea sp. K2]MCL3861447.1 zinc-dependent metalloprotease [Actinotalea sp. K2]